MYRTIAEREGSLLVDNFRYKAEKNKPSEENFPKEFLCMSLVKSFVTCGSVCST
jgi:hypothetical protein